LALLLNANLWRSENAALDLTVTISSTSNEVVSLGGQPPVVQNATMGQYHVEGFPLKRRWHAVHLEGKTLSLTARTFLEFILAESGQLVGNDCNCLGADSANDALKMATTNRPPARE